MGNFHRYQGWIGQCANETSVSLARELERGDLFPDQLAEIIGLNCIQKGSMMELQTLQEALKVEIQVHQKLVAQMKQDPQNADLKRQLHELQAKITALSEKQKKVVEQLRKDLLVKQEPPELKPPAQAAQTVQPDGKASARPSAQAPQSTQQKTVTVTSVLTTKTLPLVLKASTPTMPASLVMQRPTITMVTAISSMPNPSVINDSQNTPINLQTSGKLTNQGAEAMRVISKNAVMVQATTTAQPIKVPQFIPPTRLTPRPNFLPQVRPKPITPNVPIAPAAPPMIAVPQLQATKLTPASLHSTSSPVHQVCIVNGQPCTTITKALPTGQLTGIVITTPTTATRLAASYALQIGSHTTDTKTVKAQGGMEQKASASAPPSPTPPPLPKPKREENPRKLAFMVSLGLVTHDHLKEIQSRRQERKRRTTANPVYSGAVFEPERKKSAVTYLNTLLHQGTRKRGRPPKHSSPLEPGCHTPTSLSGSHSASPAPEQPEIRGSHFPVHPHILPLPSPASGEGDIHEDFCTVCRRSGQLLMCDTCSRVYHLDCLDPPLKIIPKGMWICPKCQDQILKKEEAIPWPGTLAIVHSYIAYKAAKEEEKQKLVKWSSELKQEREQLEQRVKQLSNSITKCMETKNTILARQKGMQASLEKVKGLVRLIRGIDLVRSLERAGMERVSNGARDYLSVNNGDCGDEHRVDTASARAIDGGTEEARASGERDIDGGTEEAPASGERVIDGGTEEVRVSGERNIDGGTEEASASGERNIDGGTEEVRASGGRDIDVGTEEVRVSGERDIDVDTEEVRVSGERDIDVDTEEERGSGERDIDVGTEEERGSGERDIDEGTEEVRVSGERNINGGTEEASASGERYIEEGTEEALASGERNMDGGTEEVRASEERDIGSGDGSRQDNSKTSEPSQSSVPAPVHSMDDAKWHLPPPPALGK